MDSVVIDSTSMSPYIACNSGSNPDIYEVNKRYVKDNHLIGLFFIELPPRPAKTVDVQINLNI